MRRTEWYKENVVGDCIFTHKLAMLYFILKHIYCVFMLRNLYHSVRIIHANLTHIIIFWKAHKWLRYLQFIIPAKSWVSICHQNQPFLEKKCLQLQFSKFYCICNLFFYLCNTYPNPQWSSIKPVKPLPRVRVFRGLWYPNPHPHPWLPAPVTRTGW
jgi:hypothetical protein